MNDGMLVCDEHGEILSANNGALSLLECRKEEIVGLTMRDFIFQDMATDGFEAISGAELELINRNSGLCPVLLSATALRDYYHEIVGYVVIFQDIRGIKQLKKELEQTNEHLELRVNQRTQELTNSNKKLKYAIAHIKESEKKITKMAYHDSLTGLFNRNYFLAALRLEIKKTKSGFSVLILDLDKFKNVNDTAGHSIGDQVLYETGNRLETLLDEDDILARIGGDSFALLLKERCLSINPDERFVKCIFNVFEKPFIANNMEISLTVSIGCACYPIDGRMRMN